MASIIKIVLPNLATEALTNIIKIIIFYYGALIERNLKTLNLVLHIVC